MTGETSVQQDVLDRLMAEIHRRSVELPVGSYTTKLIQGGVAKMGAKILEEAAEVVEAAGELESHDLPQAAKLQSAPASERQPQSNHQHLIYEACDLIYHLWVLLGSRGISVDQLRTELARREGVSGLEEKRQRGLQAND